MSADQQRPHGSSDAERGSEEEPIVFNDRRRIDPETGEPRVSAGSAAEQAEDGDALAQAERILDEAGAEAGTEAPQPAASDREAELETDLRRLQAEFVNYKRARTATATWPGTPACSRPSPRCCRCSTTSTPPALPAT